MVTVHSFNKQIPASNGTVFEVTGGNPDSFLMVINNQDMNSVMVWKLQSSGDGINWVDIEFAIQGGTQVNFSILPNSIHSVRVSATSPRIRLQAYGDLEAQVTITSHRNHDATTVAPVSILV